jgi:hypothetical protein
MGGPDCIATHFAQQFQLPFSCTQIERCAQGTKIMMLIDSPDGNMLTIDKDSLVGVKFQ